MHYEWDFRVIWEYRNALLSGLAMSVILSTLSIVIGTMISIPVALALVSSNRWGRPIAAAIVLTVRSLPLLVALIFAHYLLPVVTGVNQPAFLTALIVFTANITAFAADVLRGGISAIPAEHTDAGTALGMTRPTIIRRIILPETFRRSLPALIALYISLFKYSSLASVISVAELLRTADLIVVERFKPLEIYLAVAGLYMAVIIPMGYAAQRLERGRAFNLFPRSAHD